MHHQNLQPVAIEERIQTVDFLRGFALLGIIIVNFTVDNAALQPWAGWTGIADQFAYWNISFFLNDKFQTIYCFLFGLGFSLQMLRAESRNSPFILVYLRRLAVLFLIGALHFILAGQRDILANYAMMGILLLIFHKLPQKLLLVIAVLCILIPWTYKTITDGNKITIINTNLITKDIKTLDTYIGVYQMENGNKHIITRKVDTLFGDGPAKHYYLIPQSNTTFIRSDNQNALYTFLKDSNGIVSKIAVGAKNKIFLQKIDAELGQALTLQHQKQERVKNGKALQSYKSFIEGNARTFWNGLKNWGWLSYFWGGEISGILPFFLIGLYAGRRKIFLEISANRQFLLKVIRWGFLMGLTGVGIFVGFDVWNYITGTKMGSFSYLTQILVKKTGSLGTILIALAYVAGLTLLLENINWRKRLSFLSPVGRMGLTNYLLHSAIITLTIDGYGLHLAGKIGPFWRLILALLVFMILIFISRWWFKHFRIGPAEWLWRSLTYLKFQPMRIQQPDKAEEKEDGNI